MFETKRELEIFEVNLIRSLASSCIRSSTIRDFFDLAENGFDYQETLRREVYQNKGTEHDSQQNTNERTDREDL